ncbi:hypothetical protein DFH28DRAFT_1126517 [Melampsora americana]|nr:hypothetical protein DFH28DRAFT_1126517 [Melampsora americana]
MKELTPEQRAYLETLSERDRSEIQPLEITHQAHPDVWAGLDQCIRCGLFGHYRSKCTTNFNISADGIKPKRAARYSDWRFVTNGKKYSLDVLYMAPGQSAAVTVTKNESSKIKSTRYCFSELIILSSAKVKENNLELQPCTLTEAEISDLDAIERAFIKEDQKRKRNAYADDSKAHHCIAPVRGRAWKSRPSRESRQSTDSVEYN